MSEQPKPDYDAAYALFDGDMPGCLGKTCLGSCCEVKEVLDNKRQTVRFRTSLLDDTEYDYQLELDRREPRLASLGVRLVCIRDINGAISYLVKNCLDPEIGCKLARIRRKPVICRVAPMGLGLYALPDTDCPFLDEIEREGGAELRSMVQEMDRLSGFTNRTFARFQAARKRLR